MSQHFKTLSAVLPVVLREREGRKEVLLLRRANTGYMDGKWDFAGSGHVEEGETAARAVCRELLEETGLMAKPEDAVFLHVNPPITISIFKSKPGRGNPPFVSRRSAAAWSGFPWKNCRRT